MDSNLLGLTRNNNIEWEQYIYGLKSGGIILSTIEDQVSWTWNNRMRGIIAKEAYSAQWHGQQEESLWWYTSVWKWNSPLKCNIFFCLALNNNILTWNNIVWRGFNRPRVCSLCKQVEETFSHLLISCPFTQMV